MRQIKFRAGDEYLTFDVPDDAKQMIGFDTYGNEVYFDDEIEICDNYGYYLLSEEIHPYDFSRWTKGWPHNYRFRVKR